MTKLWSLTGELLGVLKQGSRIKQQWSFPLTAAVQGRRNQEARELIQRLRHKPMRPVSGVSTGPVMFEQINSHFTEGSPTYITTAEMIKNLNELDQMMPKETDSESRLRSRRR